MRYESGVEFGGRYSLTDRIAVGGMGEVWRARDKVLARRVAIKLLSPTLAGQPGFAQRFREEARNSAALGHPNIAGVYDYGEDAGANWLVMELVEGQNLAQIIRDQGRIPPAQASSILSQAALGLQAAHDGGVIHRDVKPANIIIRPDGVVKLTDFGISRAVDSVPITRTGEVMGTAQYISSEQATGQAVSPASDVYALGVVAYEMVTGRRPFDEESPVATAMAHVQDPPPPLPRDVPEPLATVIASALAKAPEHRPESAGDVARILTGAGGAATLLTTQKLTSPQVTRRMATTAPQPAAGRGAPAAGVDPRDSRRLQQREQYDRPRSTAWIWVLVAALLIGGGIWAAIASGLFDRGPTPTEVPTGTATTDTSIVVNDSAYVGRPLTEVSAELGRLGLLTRATQVDNDLPAGTVISVDNPGVHKRGDIIALTVSSGPVEVTPSTPQQPTEPPQQPTEPQQQPTGPSEPQQPTTPVDEPAQPPATQEPPPQNDGGGGTDGAAAQVGTAPPAHHDDSANGLVDTPTAAENAHNGRQSALSAARLHSSRNDWTVQIP